MNNNINDKYNQILLFTMNEQSYIVIIKYSKIHFNTRKKEKEKKKKKINEYIIIFNNHN